MPPERSAAAWDGYPPKPRIDGSWHWLRDRVSRDGYAARWCGLNSMWETLDYGFVSPERCEADGVEYVGALTPPDAGADKAAAAETDEPSWPVPGHG